MTNGLFVGRVILENIRCMKWDRKMKRDMIFVGWRSQEYIFMKENFEFKTAFQIHSN
jgi:hypothetical protein